MKKILLLFIFFILSVSAFVFISTSNKNKIKQETSLPSPSKDILFLTNPVNSINAKVFAIYQDKIIVSQKFTFQQSPISAQMPPLPNENPPSPIPTPIVKELIFEVLIDKDTRFERQNFSLPLLFSSPPSPKLSTADIKKDDFITITTKEDLRTIKNNQATALTISLPPITNQIQGKIIKINPESIEVEISPAFLPPEPNETSGGKKLIIKINEKTEISYLKMVKESVKMTEDSPAVLMEVQKPVKLSLNDLKINDQITIYSLSDILKTPLPLAARIEPINPN